MAKKNEIQIVDYTSRYREAFELLNREWINQYFKVEANDEKLFSDPENQIVNKGGYIAVALFDGQPCGVCALVKSKFVEYDFELSKMAVSPKVQGKGAGYLLGQRIVEKAKELGANTLFLEGNTRLEASINLYRKLGFQAIEGRAGAYERCNIIMVLNFS